MNYDNRTDFERVRLELENAINELRRMEGKKPIYGQGNKLSNTREPPLCSFCGKAKKPVGKLIEGNGVYICNECVAICNDLLED